MKRFVLSVISGFIIIYLFTTFIKWQFNPGLWTENTRICVIFVSTTWITISTIIAAALKDYTYEYERKS